MMEDLHYRPKFAPVLQSRTRAIFTKLVISFKNHVKARSHKVENVFEKMICKEPNVKK